VHGDAEAFELFRVHVATRARAEEHDMLQSLALRGDRGRQRGVIDDYDLEAFEQARELLRRHVGIVIDLDG
jgi:hypothetical protein